MALLEVEDLKVHFRTRQGTAKAVNGVSFNLERGQTLAIAGESGSGKSVTGMSLMQLNPSPPCHYAGGQIRYEGRDLLGCSDRQMQTIRGNEIAMIFQDPMSSLNPVRKIGDQIAETVRLHQGVSKRESRIRAVNAMRDVGIANPEQRAEEYAHQFSGGMRQRVMIAMGLSCNPKILIADEPTTALDVTIQAQILELMKELQRKTGMAIILITHDFGVVAGMADQVAVMYAGRVVEYAPTDSIFYDPLMPYTEALLRSVPRLGGDPGSPRKLTPIAGQPPSLLDLPAGCSFQPRCPAAVEQCRSTVPALEAKKRDHDAACLLVGSMIDNASHPATLAGGSLA